MPQYIYINDDTNETIEVFQGINDKHEYFDDSGKKWRRVFTTPQVNAIGKFDAWKSRDFVEKTGNMKGTVNDLWQKSEELSQERAEKHGGVDPIKQKKFDQYKKDTGKRHMSDYGKSIKNKNVTVEY